MDAKQPRTLSVAEQAVYEARRQEELFRAALGGADVQRIVELARLAESPVIKIWRQQEQERATIERLLGGHDVGTVAEILRWYEEIAPHQEMQEVFDLVENLASDTPDIAEADSWAEANKDGLTTETLAQIVHISMLYGVSSWMRKRADSRHEKNRKSSSNIPAEWAKYKAKGMSKNNAAPRIAATLDLSESTVRRKLQAL